MYGAILYIQDIRNVVAVLLMFRKRALWLHRSSQGTEVERGQQFDFLKLLTRLKFFFSPWEYRTGLLFP